jgi:hypothetical protein
MNKKILKPVLFQRITLFLIFIFSTWIVLHNYFYAFEDSFAPSKMLNYDFMQGLPLIHHAFNVVLVLLTIYMFLIGAKHKGWKITLITFLFLGNSLGGLLRNDFSYSMITNDYYNIHVRKYQFLWVDQDIYYCEVDSLSSVYLGTIGSGRNSETYGYVENNQLILQEIDGEEIIDEVNIDLLPVCEQK